MEIIQKFIVENLNLIIIFAIIILIVFIGYLAEKTDFGRKPIFEKKPINDQTNEDNVKKENTETNDNLEDDEIIIPSSIIDSNENDTLQN